MTKVIIHRETSKAYQISLAQKFYGQVIFGKTWLPKSIIKVSTDKSILIKGMELRIMEANIPAWFLSKTESDGSKVLHSWENEHYDPRQG